MQTIKNTNSSITIIDNEIFYVLYDDDAVISIADFKETQQAYHKIGHGKKMKVLVEFPQFVTATAEARKWAETNQVEAISEAIVFNNLGQRMLIRFYLLFRIHDHPIKTFTDKEKALDWLRTEA